MAAAFVLLAASAIGGLTSPAVATAGEDFISPVNVHRQDAGSPPTRLNAALAQIAVERAGQMARARVMAHDMAYVAQRMNQLGVCWQAYGEIIAYNSSGGAEQFVHQWYGSDGHRAIMLKPQYTIAGGSWARGGDGRAYAVMVFADPCDAAPAPTGFSDASSSPFRADIRWLLAEGITAGCSTTRFCPKATVTREQLASFVTRSIGVPAASGDWFSDDSSSAHQGDINRVAEAGIASGCAKGRFCPRAGVTRGQMASFLARAMRLPAPTRDWFRDDEGSMHESAINRLADAGVTGGCEPGRFCPDALITREQMAGFLHRAFGN